MFSILSEKVVMTIDDWRSKQKIKFNDDLGLEIFKFEKKKSVKIKLEKKVNIFRLFLMKVVLQTLNQVLPFTVVAHRVYWLTSIIISNQLIFPIDN